MNPRLEVRTVLMLAGFCWLHPCASGVDLVGADSSAAPGATLLVSVSIVTHGSPVSGIQFDLAWDDSALHPKLLPAGAASFAGSRFFLAPLGSSSARCLILGLNRRLIADGPLVRVFVFVRSDAATGQNTLNLYNVIATGPGGEPVAASGAALHVEVDPASPLRNSLLLEGVVNSASLLSGPVSPGEIVSLFGPGTAVASPPIPASQLAVLLNGLNAPLLYVGENQINAVVPFGVEPAAAATLEIRVQNQPLASVVLPVEPSQPGIFTLDTTGLGPGAILNQDLTLNSFLNPAPRGSVILIYATGLGPTQPAGVDGQLADQSARTTLTVTATIGGRDARVLYAGAAPGLIDGGAQINVRVPDDVIPGDAVPVVLSAGEAPSPGDVTVAVR